MADPKQNQRQPEQRQDSADVKNGDFGRRILTEGFTPNTPLDTSNPPSRPAENSDQNGK